MNSEEVQLRHPKWDSEAGSGEGYTTSCQTPRRPRPKSASYVALRSAVYQLTSMADFKLEKIGAGFFADVYKVQHKSTGEVMVLKMNKSSKTSRSMLSEIQLMNRLSHPNILKFKGSCVHEGHLHALTEYINGGSLEELLENEAIKLPWGVRMKIIRDIVSGMVYLHSKNVFHRDLNPKNCLIQRAMDGKLLTVVADFGLAAKIKQRRRRSHTEAVGSPYWMAPELLKGKSYCEQADVFSFGITLAEIMARISADPDFMPRTQKFGLDVSAIRPMCAEGCPEELFDLLDKCCQIDPDDRPNFEEISQFLESVHLPEDQDALDPTTPLTSSFVADTHRSDSNRDLRACISEPFIRLNDVTDDDSRSCGSEGESRVIVEHHHQQRLLGSLGSSTCSSCGSIPPKTSTDGMESKDFTDTAAGSSEVSLDTSDPLTDSIDTSDPLTDSIDTSDPLTDSIDTSDPLTDSVDTSDPFLDSKSGERGAGNNGLFRRSSDGTLHVELPGGHRALQKSKSLTTELKDDPFPPQLPIARCLLNSSAQTLVPEDELAPCDSVDDRGGIDSGIDPGSDANGRDGGGDSGIDPGDVEVFKFPPKSLSRYASAGDQGDHTPICTSPALNGDIRYCGPISTINGSHDQAITRSHDQDVTNITGSHDQDTASPDQDTTINGSHDQDMGSRDLDYLVSPVQSRFSFSGTSSDDMDGQNLVTPSGRCTSPLAQSWTSSSECSFSLPTPSMPWAPPSSPIPPHTPQSLPSSPSHYACHSVLHRKSLDITTTGITSCLRKTSLGRPKSCRNSALFPELSQGEDGGEMRQEERRLSIKSVHFMDFDESYSDEVEFRRRERIQRDANMGRPRSESNPPTTYRGDDCATADLRAAAADEERVNRDRSDGGDYGIRLQYDSTTADPHACKCYKIAQRSNTRLSSSTPDLSKSAVPILMAPVPTPASN